jgi:hypothetical protein
MNPQSLLHRRDGWSVIHEGTDGLHASYAHSLYGLNLAPPRVSLEQLGICYLWCHLTATGHARIDTCGVVNGCFDHRVHSLHITPAHLDDLPRLLSRFETAAREIDVRELCYCVLAGPCARNPTPSRPPTGGVGC